MKTILKRTVSAALVFTAAACATAVPPGEEPVPKESPGESIRSASDLVREMHDRYADNWYRTLRFEQTNTFYTQSGREEKSKWRQNLSVPGKLRIDFEPLGSKSGLLILNNRVTTFDNGRKVDTRRSIQPILTLTADIYAIPPAVTLRRLDSLQINLDKFRTDKLNKKRVYVVGAHEGDLESSQIWIDAERLLLVRLIRREKRGERTIVTDTRVGEYRDVDGYPVAHEFVSTRDGKPYFREEYANVRVNEPIPASVFDPSRWASSRPAG
ncbi:MAG TPA: hypothetical protein VHM24_01195 [Gemmatimonadaceae bacterium]|nr:hypothetical protein [Gemmatimonadaceae bacterium]